MKLKAKTAQIVVRRIWLLSILSFFAISWGLGGINLILNFDPRGMAFLIMIPFVAIAFSVFLNLVVFPYWLILLLVYILLQLRKAKEAHVYTTLFANIVIGMLGVIAILNCLLTSGCTEDSSPLGSGFAWLVAYFIGNLICTYPVLIAVNKFKGYVKQLKSRFKIGPISDR